MSGYRHENPAATGVSEVLMEADAITRYPEVAALSVDGLSKLTDSRSR